MLWRMSEAFARKITGALDRRIKSLERQLEGARKNPNVSLKVVKSTERALASSYVRGQEGRRG